MKKITLTLLIALIAFYATGCGETVSGIGKDATRIGRGVKTVFVRD